VLLKSSPPFSFCALVGLSGRTSNTTVFLPRISWSWRRRSYSRPYHLPPFEQIEGFQTSAACFALSGQYCSPAEAKENTLFTLVASEKPRSFTGLSDDNSHGKLVVS
jgi:hypothetical protein